MIETLVKIGLVNPKSPTNVGGVMRAAGCYQASEVRYTGKRYALAAKNRGEQYNTDTKRASENIPLIAVENILEGLDSDTKVVCVDLVEGAVALPEFQHPAKAIYLFGPEDGTIDQGLIDSADAVVYVPTVGCMNLASSVNVLLYDRLAKGAPTGSDALIRQSRDTNNRVKVKR
ncbi:RNA methyltransferase [Shewanella colwelliana]|uniref:RNA methyltransferase n=1 Tax=Shewanella colwelliana TaxID=23 RepID=UPI0022AF3256|nr:RNA methyltransferase [Shewanella colwelliana]MCZ4338773.1 RNA methyltransferase [Shewanella colwelliana]